MRTHTNNLLHPKPLVDTYMHNTIKNRIDGVVKKSLAVNVIRKASNISLDFGIFLMLFLFFIHFSLYKDSGNISWIGAYFNLIGMGSIFVTFATKIQPNLDRSLNTPPVQTQDGDNFLVGGFPMADTATKGVAFSALDAYVDETITTYANESLSYFLSIVSILLGSYIQVFN